MARILLDVPISIVSLVDIDRQWFKSCQGLKVDHTSRSVSFCAHAILRDDIFLIQDATTDERFKDNPLVTGPPFIRFYAGKPIHSPDSYRIGTLCVISDRPRGLSHGDRMILCDLAEWVESEITLFTTNTHLTKANQRLEKEAANRKELFSMINHDLKNLLNPVVSLSQLLTMSDCDAKFKEYAELIHDSSLKMESLTNSILDIFDSDQEISRLNVNPESIRVIDWMTRIEKLLKPLMIPKQIDFKIKTKHINQESLMMVDPIRLDQIILNLVQNAIDFVPEEGKIQICLEQKSQAYLFIVADNGIGIPPKKQKYLFTRMSKSIHPERPRTNNHHTGLGLMICKQLIEGHGGQIEYWNGNSQAERKTRKKRKKQRCHLNSNFRFTIPIS
jgi:signal transduction histidine kinase